MVLQVVTVPNPAAGRDWSFTIPGQYVAALVAVTAQLITATNPTTAIDSSANAFNGTYNAANTHWHPGAVGPFGGGGNAIQTDSFALDSYIASFDNSGGQLDFPTFSFDALVNFSGNGNVNVIKLVGIRDPNIVNNLRFMFGPTSPTGTLAYAPNDFVVHGLGPGATVNTWVHIGFSYDGAQWVGYRNGTAGPASIGNPPQTTVTGQPFTIGADIDRSQPYEGKLAAIAYYSGALAAARFAAHSAAVATSAAAYKAAVLADTPAVFWMLDEVATHFQRTAILQVSDGTSTLAAYPGYAPTQESPLFSWNWTTGAAGASQLPNQSTTVIPIAAVPLFPGYKVGTVTPDMQPGDQWQNIAIWLDETPTGGGSTAGVGYLDGTLTPQYGRT